MIRMNTTIKDETPKVAKAVEEYKVESLSHAAGLVRKTAQRSVRRRTGDNYAEPGKPAKTAIGRLRKSIIYNVDRGADEAIIGPTSNVIGSIGALHEFGGKTRSGRYPARPYMGPAFEKILPRLPESWRRKIRPGGG